MEERVNRQVYVLGKETQESISKSRVLVVGCDALGCEVLKNLALTGVKALHLLDHSLSRAHDQCCIFPLAGGQEGERAHRVAPHVQQLSPYLEVKVEGGHIGELQLQGFHVVVACNLPLPQQEQLDKRCRAAGVPYVSCGAREMLGYVFCDFGESHLVSDADGEAPRSGLIVSAMQAEEERVRREKEEEMRLKLELEQERRGNL